MEKAEEMPVINVPELKLVSSSGNHDMSVIGLGSAVDSLDETGLKLAVLEAIKIGYRHFDTAAMYGSEVALGEAIAESLKLGLISSRQQLFVTSKLLMADSHRDLVVPALQKSLRNLKLEYLDLYLIHWPIAAKPGTAGFPKDAGDLMPLDYEGVWAAMEECQRLGLTKSIGVSNFSCKKLETILALATIPPSVNQVEMNPVWQQKKLREFCAANNVIVTAFSPLGAKGASWGTNQVMENETLKEIANARGKTVAQISLRWIVEQGASVVVKSFNKERLKENLQIFDWALTKDDYLKINKIQQNRFLVNEKIISAKGPFKSAEELWDGEL